MASAILLLGMNGGFVNPIAAYADDEDQGIEIRIDSHLDENLVAVFELEDSEQVEHSVEVSFSEYPGLDGDSIFLDDGSNPTILGALSEAVDSVTGYDPDNMEFFLESRVTENDFFTCVLAYDPDASVKFSRADGSDGGVIAGEVTDGYHFNIRMKNNGGNGEDRPGPGPERSVAHIEIESADTVWTGIPCVYEEYYPFIDEIGTISWNYKEQKSWQYASVSVNNGERKGFNDSDQRHTVNPRTSVDAEYDQGEDSEHIDVSFSFNWGYRPTDVIGINGTEYHVSDYVDFDDRQSWLDAFSFEYRNQDISITIPDVPANVDGEGVANLHIVLDLRPITEEECYIGNFLWSSNPNPDNPDDDMYIGHSDLALISATYPDELGGKTFKEDILEAESRVSKSDKTAKYITYGVTNGDGEMVLPVGTKVTMRVAPEFGYQVTSFRINGTPIENEKVITGNEIAVFTFTIDSANFHLGADVVPVDNVVAVKETDGISGGSVDIGKNESSMTVGTAKLEVEGVDLLPESVTKFEEAAPGYDITDYVDISLFNTVYKGTDKESWDTPVGKLESDATITLKLEEAVNGDMVIIHAKSDGTYETLDTEYNAADNSITFKTDSFSYYAIAQKSDPTKDLDLEWNVVGEKAYWYEEGIKQGTAADPKAVFFDDIARGREIYDSDTDKWYWLDADADGAAAVSKEVFMPYVYQNEKAFDEVSMEENAENSDDGTEDYILNCMKNNLGKWVRYDENGGMMKGWVEIEENSGLSKIFPDQVGNKYYYDNKTGAMVKGDVCIDGVDYHFDEITGVCTDKN